MLPIMAILWPIMGVYIHVYWCRITNVLKLYVWHIIMPSSEDSAGHNPSRVSIDNGRLKTHKFSMVKNENTAKNVNARN